MNPLPPCQCSKMITKLTQLGATHAATMHKAHAQDTPYEWSPQDWEMHFREEEQFIFPKLIMLGQRAYVEQLRREHAVFRRSLQNNGSIDTNLMKNHADLEDRLVLMIP